LQEERKERPASLFPTSKGEAPAAGKDKSAAGILHHAALGGERGRKKRSTPPRKRKKGNSWEKGEEYRDGKGPFSHHQWMGGEKGGRS